MDLSVVRACRIAAFAMSAAIALGAVTVLVGWTFSLRALSTLGAGGVSMNPLTAVCLVLLSAALLIQLPQPHNRIETGGACVLAIAVAAIAAAKLFMIDQPYGPDTWLFRRAVDAATPLNRMAPNTALLLIPIALAIALLDVKIRRHRPAQWLVLATLPLTLVIAVGILFSVSEFYGWGSYIPMARGTALALPLLQLAILAGRVEHGLTAIFAAPGAGGIAARRLLPAAVFAPLAIGYLRLLGHRRGLYSPDFGVVLFTLTMTLVFAVLVWWTARSVHRVDSARAEMEVRLQTLVRHVPLGIVVIDLDGRVQLCNDAFVELFHYSAAELNGQRVDDFIAPEEDGGETASLTQRGVAGESLRRRTVRRRRDGTLIDVEVFVVPLALDGRAIGTYGVYRALEDRRSDGRVRASEIA